METKKISTQAMILIVFTDKDPGKNSTYQALEYHLKMSNFADMSIDWEIRRKLVGEFHNEKIYQTAIEIHTNSENQTRDILELCGIPFKKGSIVYTVSII